MRIQRALRHMPPRSFSAKVLLLLIGFVAPSSICTAQLPTIRLQSLSPRFFKPGQTVDVTLIEGGFLEHVSELVFSTPGIQSQRLKPETDQGTEQNSKSTFRVTVGDDVAEGRYDVRAVGRFGVSNPRSIFVHCDVVAQSSSPDAADHPIPIELNRIYQASAQTRKQIDFSLPVEEAQDYEVALIAATVDSQLFPSVSVRDESGDLITSVIGGDTEDLTFRFAVQNESSVTLSVHDAVYRGGPSFGFGIVVRPAASSQKFLRNQIHRIHSVRSVSVRPSAEADPIPPWISAELSVPTTVQGFLGQPSRSHYYLCALQQSQPVRIEVQSDRLGQSTDIRMLVELAEQDKNGARQWKQVAIADDSQAVSDSIIRLATTDPITRFSPPKDGTYRMTLIDANRRLTGSKGEYYQLQITPAADYQWSALAYPMYPHRDVNATQPRGVLVRRGGATVYRVFLLRDGLRDPVRVSVEGLPDGFHFHDAWIAADQNQTDLVIVADDDIAAFAGPLQIVATRVNQQSSDDDTPQRQLAQAATVTVAKSPVRPNCRTRLSDSLWIASSDELMAPVSIVTDNDRDQVESTPVGKGESIKWPIKIIRREGGKEAIVLRPRNLPRGVKVPELTIPKNETSAEWKIEVTDNAKPGKYSFWGQGETQVKSIGEAGSTKDFTMFIPTPLFIMEVK